MPDELIDSDDEGNFIAGEEISNSAPVTLSRLGSYVRETANSTNIVGSSNWITNLTNSTTNPPHSFSGTLHEVIAFNRKLSVSEREEVYKYLSLKYGLEEKLPEDMKSVRNSVSSHGRTAAYWLIESHPNKKNLKTLPYGAEFSGITLSEFFEMPKHLYKSAGTRLSNGSVLAGDTYSNIGL